MSRTGTNSSLKRPKAEYAKIRRSDAALRKLIAEAKREAKRMDREALVAKGTVMVIGPFPHDCIVRVEPMPRRRQKR